MPINDPSLPAVVRQPRMRVLADGATIPGSLSFRVTSNNNFHADQFSASFALNADAAYGAAFWGAKDSFDLEIQVSLDGGGSWSSIFKGQVDRISVSLDGGTCEITGRDLSARLIDAKTQETFQNKTASQIATILAGRHGLTPDVQATSTPVGRYYSQDHDHITGNQFTRTTNEWDLLVYLAQREQYDVWVTGTTLHFKPGPQQNDDPYLVIWQNAPKRSNSVNVSLERSLTLASDVVVEVRSWNSRHAKGFSKTNGPALSSVQVGKGRAQRFIFTFPNLTEDEAMKKAASLRRDITRHERLLSFTAPGDPVLTARNMVELRGTGSSWDQRYYVDNIELRMDYGGGYMMDVHCKNHSPQNETQS